MIFDYKDLSFGIASTMIKIPSPKHIQTSVDTVSTVQSDIVKRTMVHLSVHSGTHIDSPSHVLEDGMDIEQLPVASFFGKACILNIPKHPMEEIGEADIEINDSDFDYLIINTGWYKHFGDDNYYNDYPYLSDGAVKKILKFNLRGLGVDMPSLDRFGDRSFKIHKQILGKRIVVIESLTNLQDLPANFDIITLPMKINGAEAAPARVIAQITR